MCGRYITKDQRALERELPYLDVKDWPQFEASYNIAPTQLAPVVVATAAGNVCQPMRFGLIPFFAKAWPASTAPSMRGSKQSRYPPAFAVRGSAASAVWCSPAVFFKWHLLPDGKSKQAYFIKPADQDSFGFAGLWDSSKAADGTITYSFAIITLPASPLMAQIHNTRRREPAMLTPDGCRAWLAGAPKQGRTLLQPYPDDQLVAWPVSTRVNSPKNNDHQLIEPVAQSPS
jgi:putative SOS response-associated peptidase YedK